MKLKQMFTVTCSLTGTSVKVRRPVFENRIARVQKLVRTNTGAAISKAEAQEVLNERYVSLAARKANNVDMLGNSLEGSVLIKPKLVKKSESPKAPRTRKATKIEAPTTAPEATEPEASAQA